MADCTVWQESIWIKTSKWMKTISFDAWFCEHLSQHQIFIEVITCSRRNRLWRGFQGKSCRVPVSCAWKGEEWLFVCRALFFLLYVKWFVCYEPLCSTITGIQPQQQYHEWSFVQTRNTKTNPLSLGFGQSKDQLFVGNQTTNDSLWLLSTNAQSCTAVLQMFRLKREICACGQNVLVDMCSWLV